MEGYIVDWLQLLFRWLHLITGIAWIGASFYFVWLDNSLREPPQWKKDKGIKGDLWAIHGGGIYEVAKYQLEPETMPKTLHWFKWEAYTTWLTGIVLLTVIYYLGAESYLIDKRVADLTQLQAVSIGIGFLVGGWLIYDVLCRTPLAKNGYAIGGALIIVAVVFSYALTHLFSGRGAYIHMGAVIGTIMVGNVFRVIIPSQKALVAAIETGATPDPSWAIKAKLHSTHNNYLTLPVLFIMISNHYPMTYSHEYNWIVLLAIIAITAFARHYFNLEHKGIKRPSILIGAGIATAVLAFAIVPKTISQKPSGDAQTVPSIATVQGILDRTLCKLPRQRNYRRRVHHGTGRRHAGLTRRNAAVGAAYQSTGCRFRRYAVYEQNRYDSRRATDFRRLDSSRRATGIERKHRARRHR